MQDLSTALWLITPLLLGLAFHGLCIRSGWLHSLAVPIDAGRTIAGVRLFGANKTYRGLLAVALGTAAGFAVVALLRRVGCHPPAELFRRGDAAAIGVGFLAGAAAMLSELANSAAKRRLGIAPGAAGAGAAGALFYVLDQVDMLAGVWLVLWSVVAVTPGRVAWSALYLFVAHQVMTAVGYRLGMRATAR